ncbi:FixH family protein [Luteimonas sp. Y-2-2-4F]|nr:FixH family protein [Luteimonas sp. Y-2-2-4F]MCD9033547.1 FixH family protein [Luteimonas sp. Y-2-2-4F]
MNDPVQKKRPPWREPMLWLVFGLPLASIVAGVSLVVIATRSGGADAVRDDVQRVSQIQTADLGPDGAARRMHLAALLRLDEGGGAVEVIAVNGAFDRAAPLRLTLEHPAQAREDLDLLLAPSNNGWRTESQIDLSHDWILQLAPEGAAWRLRGRLPAGQLATRLAPASP